MIQTFEQKIGKELAKYKYPDRKRPPTFVKKSHDTIWDNAQVVIFDKSNSTTTPTTQNGCNWMLFLFRSIMQLFVYIITKIINVIYIHIEYRYIFIW